MGALMEELEGGDTPFEGAEEWGGESFVSNVNEKEPEEALPCTFTRLIQVSLSLYIQPLSH
jgi:hypothetical protein